MSKPELTTPERMMALITKNGQLDRVPVHPFVLYYAANIADITLKDFFLYPEKAFDAHLQTMNLFQYDAGPAYDNPGMAYWDFGGDLEFPTEPRMSLPRIPTRLINKEEDVYNLQVPDILTAPGSFRTLEFNRLCAKNGFGPTVKGGSMLELMQQLMGVDMLLKWLVKKQKIQRR